MFHMDKVLNDLVDILVVLAAHLKDSLLFGVIWQAIVVLFLLRYVIIIKLTEVLTPELYHF